MSGRYDARNLLEPPDDGSKVEARNRMSRIELIAIGSVSSILIDMDLAPRQPDEGAPEAWLISSPRRSIDGEPTAGRRYR